VVLMGPKWASLVGMPESKNQKVTNIEWAGDSVLGWRHKSPDKICHERQITTAPPLIEGRDTLITIVSMLIKLILSFDKP